MSRFAFARHPVVVIAVAAVAALPTLPAWAQAAAPEALIQQLSTEVIDAVKADKAIQGGDVAKVRALVDAKVIPHVDFPRMTASVVGRSWRTATPDQQARMQAEFKTLLVRTYAGALTKVKDQTVALLPFRGSPTDTQVVVRTQVKGSGDPIQLDYRLAKGSDGKWMIYDMNVLGVWLVDQYKSNFAPVLGNGGMDKLIADLAAKNQAASGAAAPAAK